MSVENLHFTGLPSKPASARWTCDVFLSSSPKVSDWFVSVDTGKKMQHRVSGVNGEERSLYLAVLVCRGRALETKNGKIRYMKD